MRARHPFASPSAPARAGGAFSSRPMRPRSRRSHALALLATLSVCLALSADAATLYLDQSAGDDTNDGLALDRAFGTAKEAVKALRPGDELRVVGVLANPSYDPDYRFADVSDPHLWHGENTLVLSDVHGTEGAWITVTSHDENTVLKGDGGNIVRINESSYVRLKNLEVYGEAERIPLETAKAVQFAYKDAKDGDAIKYRVDPSLSPKEIDALTLEKLGSDVPRVSYTDTRGVYVSDSHHVELSGSRVHHLPGDGVRFAKSEFFSVFDNEVDNCARKSYSGTHALVATYTTDLLPRETDAAAGETDYRGIIVRNKVHHNFNEIFSWTGTKTFVHAKIDEGKGISLQRNQKFKDGGRILVANNVAFWNGYSGIHSQDSDNVDMFSNTAYMNSYTNTRGEYRDDGDARGGNDIGVSVQGGEDVRVANNVAYIDTSWRGMPVSIANEKGNVVVANNLVYGEGSEALKLGLDFERLAVGTVNADPEFEFIENESGDSEASKFHSFRPSTNSPAIGAAAARWTPCEDFFGNRRSSTAPSIGAVEVNCADGACGFQSKENDEAGVGPKDFAECYGLNRDAPTSEDEDASSSDVAETEESVEDSVEKLIESMTPVEPAEERIPPPIPRVLVAVESSSPPGPVAEKTETPEKSAEKKKNELEKRRIAERKARREERREERRRKREAQRQRLAELGSALAAATSEPVGQFVFSAGAFAAAAGVAALATRRKRVVAETKSLGFAPHSRYGAVVAAV